jgi:SHS family lactate transporter-like MFS transporter
LRFHSSFTLLTAVFIPLWIIPTSFSGLAAGAFCVQFGVQGAWGVVSAFFFVLGP